MDQVILGFTVYEIIFCGLSALAITIMIDDHLEKKKLIKAEIEKQQQLDDQRKEKL